MIGLFDLMSLQLQLSTPVQVLLCLAMVSFLLMCVSTVCYHYQRLRTVDLPNKAGCHYTRVERVGAI